MNNPEFFNSLDYIFLGIFFGSIFIGFVRGFTKDFFGTFTWIGSGIIATFMGPHVAVALKSSITNPSLVKGTALVISYVAALVVLNLIVNMFSRQVKASFLSGVDRLLGSLFGLVRGAGLLISTPILLLMAGIPQSRIEATKNSKIATVLYKGAAMLMPEISRATGIKPITPKIHSPTATDFSKIPIEKKKKEEGAITGLSQEDSLDQMKEALLRNATEIYQKSQEEMSRLSFPLSSSDKTKKSDDDKKRKLKEEIKRQLKIQASSKK